MEQMPKYRAWDKIENEMLHVSALYLEKGVSTFGIGVLDEHNDFHRIEDIVLEQFTGLHDSTKWEDLTEKERTEWTRNGKFPSQWAGRDIYEGDILSNGSWIVPVVFKNGAFVLPSGRKYVKGLYSRLKFGMVKIGNIHENADLLREGKK